MSSAEKFMVSKNNENLLLYNITLVCCVIVQYDLLFQNEVKFLSYECLWKLTLCLVVEFTRIAYKSDRSREEGLVLA